MVSWEARELQGNFTTVNIERLGNCNNSVIFYMDVCGTGYSTLTSLLKNDKNPALQYLEMGVTMDCTRVLHSVALYSTIIFTAVLSVAASTCHACNN